MNPLGSNSDWTAEDDATLRAANNEKPVPTRPSEPNLYALATRYLMSALGGKAETRRRHDVAL